MGSFENLPDEWLTYQLTPQQCMALLVEYLAGQALKQDHLPTDSTGLIADILALIEPPMFEAALKKAHMNQAQAAKLIGISDTYLRKQIATNDELNRWWQLQQRPTHDHPSTAKPLPRKPRLKSDKPITHQEWLKPLRPIHLPQEELVEKIINPSPTRVTIRQLFSEVVTEVALYYLEHLNVCEDPQGLLHYVLSGIEPPMFKAVLNHTDMHLGDATQQLGISRAYLTKQLNAYPDLRHWFERNRYPIGRPEKPDESSRHQNEEKQT